MFFGEDWTDTVTLTPGLVIKNQSIGVSSFVNGVNVGTDDILGLGPVGLTSDTVSNMDTVPTVSNNICS